jgi:hypothetical protein
MLQSYLSKATGRPSVFDSREDPRPAASGELTTSPSDFTTVRELLPGEAPYQWDGLNTPPVEVGVLWVDVNLDRAPLRSLQLLLSSLCPGIQLERITDLYVTELEQRFQEPFPPVTPDVSIVRSFGWVLTCWHAGDGRDQAYRAVERRWQELGPRDAMTAGDLAAILIDELSERRERTCKIA